MSWDLRFEEPVPLPGGKQARTLREAAWLRPEIIAEGPGSRALAERRGRPTARC